MKYPINRKALKQKEFKQKEVDTALFNDEIAEKTKWSSAKTGALNFAMHKLYQPFPYRVEFAASKRVKRFLYALVAVGITSLAATIYFSFTSPYNPGNILIFGGSGIALAVYGCALIFFGARPIVFDKLQGYFWRGYRALPFSSAGEYKKALIRLDRIHAVQVIRTSYNDYELNLIFMDALRINIAIYGSAEEIKNDAAALAGFLNVPAWDAS